MNYWYLGAAGLSGLTVLAHVFGGGPEVHAPVLQSGLSDYFKAIFSVIWHAISAILIINSLVLLGAGLGRPRGEAGALIVGVQYFSFAVLFVFYGLSRLDNLSQMPQWAVFFAVPLLVFFGWRSGRRAVAAG